VNSKRKGKVGELELAAFFREHGLDARRGVQYKGGSDSPDLLTSLSNYHIEAKRTERVEVINFLKQATADASADHVPVVMWRKNHHRWVAMLWADDFLSKVERR
tara:strand:+ start:1915 stop:2226 length:312 start_codon:yes stop_codon:yes gene_type:complete